MLAQKKLSGYRIYVEIINSGIDDSEIFDSIIEENGGIVVKTLNKKIDYIVFKEGSDKTMKYAIENNIKTVNPLWIDDTIKGKFTKTSDYLVKKKTMTEIELKKEYEKKKKPQQVVLLGIKRKKENVIKEKRLSCEQLAESNFKITSFFSKHKKEN